MSVFVKVKLKTAAVVFCVAAFAAAFPAAAADRLDWRTREDRVSADIRSTRLDAMLEQVAAATGWRIYLEPDATHIVSTKFKDLVPGEALRLLLGDMNFALVRDSTNSATLYVFRTSRQSATQLIRAKPADQKPQGKRIPNELVVTLKPGANIDDIAKQLGAKVIGRIPGLNAYRLQFSNEDATGAARSQLAANPDVASVEDNFSIDRPPGPRNDPSVGGGPPHLQLTPPPSNGRIIVGLVDTAVQPLGNDLDRFLLKQVSVASDSPTASDTPLHGTSMAETILRGIEALTKGSTSVQILPVDVYGSSASTSTFDVANGIVRAINGGATVVNLSLGSYGDSPLLRNVVQDAIQNKIALFAAAGNEPVTTPFYPAAYSDIGLTAVTATDHGQLAPYANRGSFINVAAPGSAIVNFDGQSWYVVGTSTSTAVVSGIAAGYMDANHAGADKAQTYIRNTLGVVKSGAGP